MAVAREQDEVVVTRSRQLRPKLRRFRDRLLVAAISAAGLAAIVVAVAVAIVLGLGRRPTDDEGALLALSMVAAAVASVIYATGRERLSRFARRVVYGERPPPEEVLRAFGGRMTRSLPLDELLLQLAELLRRTLALDAAEVWAGSGDVLERAASDPDRGPATMALAEAERPVLARAAVAGPGWLRVWLPDLLEGRDDADVRVAPISQSGEQASLEQLRRQAEELRASRARRGGGGRGAAPDRARPPRRRPAAPDRARDQHPPRPRARRREPTGGAGAARAARQRRPGRPRRAARPRPRHLPAAARGPRPRRGAVCR